MSSGFFWVGFWKLFWWVLVYFSISSGFFLMGFGFFVGSAKIWSVFCQLSKFLSVSNDDGSHVLTEIKSIACDSTAANQQLVNTRWQSYWNQILPSCLPMNLHNFPLRYPVLPTEIPTCRNSDRESETPTVLPSEIPTETPTYIPTIIPTENTDRNTHSDTHSISINVTSRKSINWTN